VNKPPLDFRLDSPAMEAVDAAMERWTGAEEVLRAMEWALARDPEIGRAEFESGAVRVHTIDGARSRDLPTLTVMYRIENPYITVLEAWFRDAKYGQSGSA